MAQHRHDRGRVERQRHRAGEKKQPPRERRRRKRPGGPGDKSHRQPQGDDESPCHSSIPLVHGRDSLTEVSHTFPPCSWSRSVPVPAGAVRVGAPLLLSYRVEFSSRELFLSQRKQRGRRFCQAIYCRSPLFDARWPPTLKGDASMSFLPRKKKTFLPLSPRDSPRPTAFPAVGLPEGGHHVRDRRTIPEGQIA